MMEIAIYKSQNLSGGGGTKHKLYYEWRQLEQKFRLVLLHTEFMTRSRLKFFYYVMEMG